MDIGKYLEHSDFTETEKAEITESGTALNSKILSRSLIYEIRNCFRPPGELYLPVYYDSDLMIKLVDKPAWGGYVLFLTVWDLLVVDLDGVLLEDIEESINYYYPEELFYIRQTTRGFHAYLVSKKVNHSSQQAIYMNKKLGADPAHATNSLYTGPSVRLTHKNKSCNSLVSQYVCSIGSGSACPEALALYQRVSEYIERYSNYGPDTILSCSDIFQKHREIQEKGTMGALQILVTSSLNIEIDQIRTQTQCQKFIEPLIREHWSRFLKYRKINQRDLPLVLMGMHRNMCYNNLYRILTEIQDYAVVIHLQEYCMAVVYRDLFMIDYDTPARLAILARFVRRNPEYVFRVVKTTKGFHAFMTAFPIPHDKSLSLLQRLRSDPCHILSTLFRGYSVRVNQKRIGEKPYRPYHTYGTAVEDPRLVNLYNLHLQLNLENVTNKVAIFNSQKRYAKKNFDIWNGLKSH